MSAEPAHDIVEDDDNDFEIVIEDDTPEEDRNRPKRADGVDPDIPDDDEISTYTERAQKRIKKMKWEYHEERRAKEEAKRLQEEAIKYAQIVHQENERLKKTLEEGEGMLISQATARVKAELARAERELAEAHENGDTAALVEAQKKLNKLLYDQNQINGYKPTPRRITPPPQQYMQQRQQPQVQRPDDRTMEWAQQNPWFGKNKRMTGFAYGIHEELIEKGVAPSSEEYYNQIDTAMRRQFPDEFDDAQEGVAVEVRQKGSVVAPNSRGSKRSRKQVQLNASEVYIAKRLGVTPEQYAAQKMKDRLNG